MHTGYDIIGDVHGHATRLKALLSTMGYRESGGAWRHPDRQAIFVGDLVDQGAEQAETLATVRNMVVSGNALAIMGNHEFNAVAWHTPHPDNGDRLRTWVGEKGQNNRNQHQAFLAEFEKTPAHQEAIDWFLGLPLWLDLPELRVVHACWHPESIARVRSRLESDRLPRSCLVEANTEGAVLYSDLETLLKGIEVPLPEGVSFTDKHGKTRHTVRVRWWMQEANYREAAILPAELRASLPDAPLSPEALPGYRDSKPVFFGHYWMTGEPRPLGERAACVDYSAGKGGPMVAYRFGGEAVLTAANFVAV